MTMLRSKITPKQKEKRSETSFISHYSTITTIKSKCTLLIKLYIIL